MRKKKPPYAKGRRACVFCGCFGTISKEHVWPIWLDELFPRAHGQIHKIGSVFPTKVTGKPIVREKPRPGHPGTTKVRVVCRACNHGWMSDLESDAKPFLVPLITGKRLNLTPEIQKTLAVWASKTAAMADHIHPQPNGVTQEDRLRLMNDLTPPDKWVVWMAAYVGGKWSDLSLARDIAYAGMLPPSVAHFGAKYIQAVTLGMGHLIFLVIMTGWEKSPECFRRFDGRGILQIWPPRERSILWPPNRILRDPQVNAVANVLRYSRVLDLSNDPLAGWAFTV